MIGYLWELFELIAMLIGFLTGNTNLTVLAGFVLIYMAIKNLKE